jgi:hypothetical protein
MATSTAVPAPDGSVWWATAAGDLLLMSKITVPRLASAVASLLPYADWGGIEEARWVGERTYG